MTEKTRSPEYRLASGALSGLRQDLLHDAFAYRPLPPLRPDGSLIRRLPERIRKHAVWAPHAAVLTAAAFITMGAITSLRSGSLLLLFALVYGALVAMTLLRPVGAFWASMAATPLVMALMPYSDMWPWTPPGFVAHLAVLTVVALRTRPRTAVWMWVLTAAYAMLFELFLDWAGYGSNSVPLLFCAALLLLATTVVHVRREARAEVAVQQSVTAVERDRRTLLEERTTIARELHDVVAHHMSVVAIQAEAAPYRVENPPPELEKAFVTIRENAVAALTELRRILGVVRAEDYEAPDAPQPVLGDLGRLLDNVREAGLDVEKTVTGSVRTLPQGVELSAYRIIQEALSNALRHAPGSSAKVEVSYVLGGLGLRVVNTAAKGLVKPSPGAGHGITGMRERVSMLGGEMTALDTEDGGYEVAVFLPVALNAEDPV
ncbi:two-component sensor histidine kinase [Streptomyces inusitatus]|uniref:histidine kinase n=1 Tax=Streptomyces inusitatus TaxID=68221 RepID=A0A918PLM9_9ACTN|nr:histidine kinase [Streptomyces inusitatus]GGZ13945.1 two-component sensor histidine kinase [Streptomyces inusitatus]